MSASIQSLFPISVHRVIHSLKTINLCVSGTCLAGMKSGSTNRNADGETSPATVVKWNYPVQQQACHYGPNGSAPCPNQTTRHHLISTPGQGLPARTRRPSNTSAARSSIAPSGARLHSASSVCSSCNGNSTRSVQHHARRWLPACACSACSGNALKARMACWTACCNLLRYSGDADSILVAPPPGSFRCEGQGRRNLPTAWG